MGDVPTTRVTRCDQVILSQRRQDAVEIRGQRPLEQIEVGRIVQQPQHLVGGQVLGSDVVLEWALIEDTPQRPLFLGKVLELLLVRAHADELLPREPHRMAGGSCDFEQHYGLTVHRHLEEAKVDLGLQQPQEPALEFFIPHSGRVRTEGGSDYRVILIAYAPHQISEGLADECRGVGQSRQILTDRPRLRVVDLELDPFGFSR